MDRRKFLRSALALSAAEAIMASRPLKALVPAVPEQHVLEANGLEIQDNGRKVQLRGMNLGGWMLIEDYMIGLPWTEWKIREQFKNLLGQESYTAFFDAFAESYIAEEDIAFLAKLGFNVVRLPFNYRNFEDDFSPGQWIESGFRQLDRIVKLCRKYGLWVILDLHAAPGAQARDQNAGSAYGETYFWKNRAFIDRTIALWGELARRYRGNATIAGYNVLGEPVTADVPLLNEFYSAAIKAIRKVDPDHLILLDPNLWAKDISSLGDGLFRDSQVIPAIHPYYQSDSVFNSLDSYPSVVNGKTFGRAALERTLDGTYDQRRIVRPVVVAEFGVWRSHPQPFEVQLAITRDLISIFEERGWSWSMWCYKDLRDMGLVTVKTDTSWRRFVEQPAITEFIQRYKSIEEPFIRGVTQMLDGTDVERDIREQWPREVSRDFDVPALDFVLRRLAGRSATELAEMARSFAFRSCEVHQDHLNVLTPFLAAKARA